MSNLKYKRFYIGNLPHIQPPGATFFVTACLDGALPVKVLEQLQEEKRMRLSKASLIADPAKRAIEEDLIKRYFFSKWDALLARVKDGPKWLADDRIAAKVAKALHYHDGNMYDLHAYTIMSNHMHYMCTPLEKDGTYVALQAIGHSIKSYTGFKCNRLLGRTGRFWQHENYDHYARDEAEEERILIYILNNPVSAGLVDSWLDWKWSYNQWGELPILTSQNRRLGYRLRP